MVKCSFIAWALSSGVNYNASYGNPEAGYPGNPYAVGYGMATVNSMYPVSNWVNADVAYFWFFPLPSASF